MGAGAPILSGLKALEESGIFPDVIAGTSIGPLIGALYASGLEADGQRTWSCIFSFPGMAVTMVSVGRIMLCYFNFREVCSVNQTRHAESVANQLFVTEKLNLAMVSRLKNGSGKGMWLKPSPRLAAEYS